MRECRATQPQQPKPRADPQPSSHSPSQAPSHTLSRFSLSLSCCCCAGGEIDDRGRRGGPHLPGTQPQALSPSPSPSPSPRHSSQLSTTLTDPPSFPLPTLFPSPFSLPPSTLPLPHLAAPPHRSRWPPSARTHLRYLKRALAANTPRAPLPHTSATLRHLRHPHLTHPNTASHLPTPHRRAPRRHDAAAATTTARAHATRRRGAQAKEDWRTRTGGKATVDREPPCTSQHLILLMTMNDPRPPSEADE